MLPCLINERGWKKEEREGGNFPSLFGSSETKGLKGEGGGGEKGGVVNAGRIKRGRAALFFPFSSDVRTRGEEKRSQDGGGGKRKKGGEARYPAFSCGAE